jgi:hypothetical protein
MQLFKSEMFSWLNRYLTMGIMPDEEKAADVVAKAEAPKRERGGGGGAAAASSNAAASAVGSRLAALRQSSGPAGMKQALSQQAPQQQQQQQQASPASPEEVPSPTQGTTFTLLQPNGGPRPRPPGARPPDSASGSLLGAAALGGDLDAAARAAAGPKRQLMGRLITGPVRGSLDGSRGSGLSPLLTGSASGTNLQQHLAGAANGGGNVRARARRASVDALGSIAAGGTSAPLSPGPSAPAMSLLAPVAEGDQTPPGSAPAGIAEPTSAPAQGPVAASAGPLQAGGASAAGAASQQPRVVHSLPRPTPFTAAMGLGPGALRNSVPPVGAGALDGMTSMGPSRLTTLTLGSSGRQSLSLPGMSGHGPDLAHTGAAVGPSGLGPLRAGGGGSSRLTLLPGTGLGSSASEAGALLLGSEQQGLTSPTHSGGVLQGSQRWGGGVAQPRQAGSVLGPAGGSGNLGGRLSQGLGHRLSALAPGSISTAPSASDAAQPSELAPGGGLLGTRGSLMAPPDSPSRLLLGNGAGE